MANKKSGNLRLRCRSCGALVREPSVDVNHDMENRLASFAKPTTHECDEQRLGVLDLVGATFDTDEDKS